MNRRTLPALIALIISLTIAIGSQSFLGACVHEDGSFGACHWASRMLLGVGGLMAAMSLLAILLKQYRSGLYIASGLTGVLGMLTPGTLIALCGMPTMRCRMVMQPSMMILFGICCAASIVGIIMNRGRQT